jgi:pyruvate-formate lyase-activating enzyme
MSDNTFCPIPWNFQAIRSNGDIRICCQANISAGQGILFKDDGSPFNAESDDLNQARNAQLMKSVRKDMLDGKWNPTCTRCQQEEAAGLNSRRHYELERWSMRSQDVIPWTSSDGELDIQQSPIRYYDLRFGNTCNLKCRMCGPTDSSAWLEDWEPLTQQRFFKDTHGTIEIKEKQGRFFTTAYDWHTSESFWKQLESNLDQIHHIYMAGGEPLMIKRHYDFLEKCVQRQLSQNITLEYNTNMTQLPPKVLHLWSQFKSVWVGASIDGFGKVAEYQRHPSKWEQVYQNLLTLNHQPDNILSWFAFTVTNYNIFHLPEFMKWKLSTPEVGHINRTRRRPIITHHMAHNPKHLNVRSLPEELKQVAKRKLESFLHWVEKQNFPEHTMISAHQICDSVIKYMYAQDYHADYWSEFCQYTRRLDQIRNESLTDIVPEYEGHYSPAEINASL